LCPWMRKEIIPSDVSSFQVVFPSRFFPFPFICLSFVAVTVVMSFTCLRTTSEQHKLKNNLLPVKKRVGGIYLFTWMVTGAQHEVLGSSYRNHEAPENRSRR